MEKENLIEVQSVSNQRNEREKNKGLEKDLNRGVFKSYHEENLNVKYMALAGMFIFPLLNIFACHTGLLELAKMINWNFVFCYIMAGAIPLLLEAAQFSTLAPFMKKLAHKRVIHKISWLNFSFFSIAIFLISGYGIFIMARLNADFRTSLAIGYILSLFFVGMTIYSHNTYQGFLYNTLNEVIELNRDLPDSEIITIGRLRKTYVGLLNNYVNQNNFDMLSLPTNEIKTEITDGKPKIGFRPVNQIINDNRFKTKRCESCNKEYVPKREASRFCSLTCRQTFHNNERKVK